MNDLTNTPKSLILKEEDKELSKSDLKKVQSNSVYSSNINILGNLPCVNHRKHSIPSTTYNKTFNDRETSTKSNNVRRESVFETNDVKSRYDVKGNPITRGKNKKQKVTFRDLLGKEKLVDFVNIPKESNKDEEEAKKKEKDSMSCTCRLF